MVFSNQVLVTQSYPILCDPLTVACWAPLSMGFSWKEYWSRLSSPSPEDLPNQRIKPGSPAFKADGKRVVGFGLILTKNI